MTLRPLALALAFLGAASMAFADPPPAAPKPGQPPADPAALAEWLEKAYAGMPAPESVRMLIAISRGSQMGPSDGWFGPSESRYSWDWLVRLHGPDVAKGIPKDKFKGPEPLFARLDRDKDGRVTAADLEWSDNSLFLRQLALARQVGRPIDKDSNGRMTPEELEAFVKKLTKDKGYATPEDLRDALFPPPPPRLTLGPMGPSTETLLKGLFSGELGSLLPGPSVGQDAPDFTLKTADGKQSYSLTPWLGKKPIVLVFGSFT